MKEMLLAAAAVGLSMAVSMWLLRLQQDKPLDRRGVTGLGVTGVHMILSLVLAALVMTSGEVGRLVTFIAGILVFYWISLIILVVAIVRWIRGDAPKNPVPPTIDGGDQNSRH